MVLQETVLFNDTVANNIAYGNRHISREAIVEAAKRSYAHQFITQLADGYDTVLGEQGVGLSGGQRQRLALARAMLRDPAILILDEATSAVDIQDEALIRRAIEEFVRGRTTFLITHSLGTLQIADRIVLMNEGRIEALGTEAELRRSSSLFRRLHEIHFQRREPPGRPVPPRTAGGDPAGRPPFPSRSTHLSAVSRPSPALDRPRSAARDAPASPTTAPAAPRLGSPYGPGSQFDTR